MTIQQDLAVPSANTIITLYELDARPQGADSILRWHPGTTAESQPVWWQGFEYFPFPILATDFDFSSGGTLPRPKLSASNIGGTLGAYIRTIGEALGAKFTRRRTLSKYLDARNFPSGNPSADPNAHFPDDVYYISRRVSEGPIEVTFEAAVAFDVQGVMLPRRQVIAGTCSWRYRGPDCGYAGPPVQTITGQPTTDPTLDRCRKTLTACRARFPDSPLPTSAFPASLLIQG